jgi:hypothetical protein
MNKNEIRRYDMLLRVRDFGIRHAADFPANSLGSRLFATVGAAVSDLTSHAAVQTSNTARQSVSSKAVARATLLEDLEIINQTARAMALELPNLDSQFRMPRGSGDHVLLNAAHAFLTDATPLKNAFISYALPQDFLETLQSNINDFEAAITTKHSATSARVAATASIDETLSRGMTAAQQLKAVVKNRYRNNPAVLAEWTTASHVAQAGGASKEMPTAPTNPPVPSEKDKPSE